MFTPDNSFWQVAQAIVLALGAPLTVANLKMVAAWSYCEKPHEVGQAWQWNNPLNTTRACCGWIGEANSIGVKIYPSPSAGIEATITTLQNGDYPTLVAGLMESNPTLFFSAAGAAEMATWGTSMACVASDFATMTDPPPAYLAPAAVASSAPGAPAWFYLALGGLGIVLGGAALVVAVSPRDWTAFVQWEREAVHQETRTIYHTRR